MHIHSLSVRNLRAIRTFEVDDLETFVVIAGQNGSGKSCVFDAIRLLKSVYGGYAANEYHQWFGEFAINLGDPSSATKLFRDPQSPIEIRATISFSESEARFLGEDTERLVQALAFQEVTGQPVDYWSFSQISVATQLRSHGPHIEEVARRLSEDVRGALAASSRHDLALTIHPSGHMRAAECKPAEVAFQAYEPSRLGVIEYHSASRTFARQQVGGINLDARAFQDQQRQQGLYNAAAKYQNIKTELASSYLRSLIAREFDAEAGADLNNSLHELFQTFFPDKRYGGATPTPNGALEFPVILATGEQHDIDELSSGEKEILYGYLKLKNSTPKNSVILLDEPELHLNPSLLQGFSDFYYRNLGLQNSNQLWLVTHSDTLLRQSVGNSNYRVFHMTPAQASGDVNQAVEILADDDVDRATIDLVGDLATYRPHGKVVILESTSENAFDVNVVKRLFPDFAKRVNLVSGGGKRRVSDLYEALRGATEQAGIKNRFFAICDRDAKSTTPMSDATASFEWDAYHLENYLLAPSAIRAAIKTLGGTDPYESDAEVLRDLRDAAASLTEQLVFQELQREVNAMLVKAVGIGGDPRSGNPVAALSPSIKATGGRIGGVLDELTEIRLEEMAAKHRVVFEDALTSDEWMKAFPGRSILARFVSSHVPASVDAKAFTNVVLDKMVELGLAPAEMKAVLDRVLHA